VKNILNDLAMLQGVGRHFLLKESTVQVELGLTEEQRAQVSQHFERVDQQRQHAFDKLLTVSPEERRKEFIAQVRRNEDAIVALLQPSQLVRLRQVAWQCHGPLAFHDAIVEAELKLSPEQRKQIRLAETKMFLGRSPPPFSGPPKTGDKAFDDKSFDSKR